MNRKIFKLSSQWALFTVTSRVRSKNWLKYIWKCRNNVTIQATCTGRFKLQNHQNRIRYYFRWLIREKNLTAIPVSAFYSPEHKYIGEKFLRFCFIKNQETLDKAASILKQWKSEMWDECGLESFSFSLIVEVTFFENVIVMWIIY